LHLGETDALDADAGNHLLIAEGEEELAHDFGVGSPPCFLEDYNGTHYQGNSSCDNEGEQDLKIS
jgi:hypothetical protein